MESITSKLNEKYNDRFDLPIFTSIAIKKF